jgi:hypothetical protein
MLDWADYYAEYSTSLQYSHACNETNLSLSYRGVSGHACRQSVPPCMALLCTVSVLEVSFLKFLERIDDGVKAHAERGPREVILRPVNAEVLTSIP